MCQETCMHIASCEAGDVLEYRLIRLVRCLEHHKGRTLAPEEVNTKHVKSRLQKRLGLLIAEGCPPAYLDPNLVPYPEKYYKPMLENLQALERAFEEKLEFPESEEEEE